MAGLILLVLLDAALGVVFPLPDPFSRFEVAPQADRVFFLGNSMFKTAFDLQAIGRDAGLGYTPPFDAHVGHYTNLWYLYVTAGFVDVKPAMVVWGFRPTYANRPAFRKREFCDVDLLRDSWDANYLAKTSSALLSRTERFQIELASRSSLFGQRERISAAASRAINRAVCLGGRAAGDRTVCRQLEGVAAGRASVADLVHRFGSNGVTTQADQQVTDRGRGFITGDRVTFDRSFVPDIAARLAAKGIRQLVVIFKPVSYTTGAVPKEDQDFVDEATRYFDAHAIPVLDLVNDERLQRRHYAEGDHYNAEGRALMTELMSRKLRAVMAAGQP